jgi:ATP-dependent Clp protease adaptor protein ClpS
MLKRTPNSAIRRSRVGSFARIVVDAFRRASWSAADVESPDIEVLTLPEVDVALPARVILYNDDVHTFDEVTVQLMLATGCSADEGEDLAVEVDQRGLACVFEGDMPQCLRVTSILEEIALHTEIKF